MTAMKRTVAFAFALVIIILVSQNSFSVASYTSSTGIASSGIIIERAHASIRKFIVLYGGGRLTDEQASYVASNFDVVDTNLGVYGFDKVKNLNPDITILMYRDIMGIHTGYEDWEEVDSHEDWFLHDIHGNRLVNKYYGWYGMDVGSTGWRNHFANFVKAKLDAYPVFDGVFADDVWVVWSDYYNHVWTVDSSLVPPEIPQRWHDDMVGMIQHVKSVLGSKLLILNSQSIGDYSKYADGVMREGFVHGRWMSDTSFGSISYWKGQVDSLQSLSGSGKYFLALSGVSTSTDEATAQKILKYCLCSYLLGVNGERASFGFNNHYGFSYLETWLHSIYEDVEPLGEPSGLYYPLDFVYARDFDNGKVLVNPDTVSHTVNLEGNYETLDGHTVSSVTLQPHTGMILIELS